MKRAKWWNEAEARNAKVQPLAHSFPYVFEQFIGARWPKSAKRGGSALSVFDSRVKSVALLLRVYSITCVGLFNTDRVHAKCIFFLLIRGWHRLQQRGTEGPLLTNPYQTL